MLNIAVIYGGFNFEREVSLNSGRNIVTSLDKSKFNVFPVEIQNNRTWILQDIANLEQINQISSGFLTEKELPKTNKIATINPWNWFADNKIDLVYLALHGEWGESGGIQSLLDYLQILYTGSDALASALAMDKLKTQEIVANYDVPIIPTLSVDFGNRANLETEIANFLQYPLFAKPRHGGSSCGNKILNNYQDSLDLKGAYILQKIIKGRELTVPVLGNTLENLVQMPIIEIVADNNFDYFDKYLSPKTQEICPAQIDANLSQKIQELAKTAHFALGCSGLSRSDFLITDKNKIFYLETNTTPGCTASSLCPKSAKAIGWSMQQFLEKQIELALKK